MMSCFRLLPLVLFAYAPAATLSAQVSGLPVRNAGIGTGIGIAGDIGFPNGAAGKGVAFGATGTAGLGPLGVSVSVARWKPKGAAEALHSVGATANLKIFGGPLIPLSVTLQGGVGYNHQEASGSEVRTFHVPVGVGIGLIIPNPVFSIKPWIAPRLDLHVQRESGGSVLGSTTLTDKNFAVSGGVDFGFLIGLSARVMYDRVMAGDAPNRPGVLSLGLGFRVGT